MEPSDLFYTYGSITQKELPLHRNPGLEFVYISQGQLNWQVEGRIETVPAGSLFFTLPWQAHGSIRAHEPGNRIHFVQLKLGRLYRNPVDRITFPKELGLSVPIANRISDLLVSQTRHTWPATPLVKTCLPQLVSHLQTGHQGLQTIGLLFTILGEMEAVIKQNLPVTEYHTPSERRILKLVERIEADCSQEWRLQDCMSYTRLQATRLTALFKQVTGDSPMTFVQRTRVQKAETLLKESAKTATEIAFSCGFSTSQHFSRVFRQFTNRTPLQYRNESRQHPHAVIQDWSPEDEASRLEAMRHQGWI